MDNIRILIVEDEAIVARFIQKELCKLGYKAYKIVATGKEAIKSGIEEEPDVILLDINLAEERDGIEVAREIIQRKRIPIIFMTGYSEATLFQRAKNVKPLAYLTKPIEIYEIDTLLKEHFKGK